MTTVRKTILYVDDDPTIRNLLNKILTAEGYSVLLAEHGIAGLQVMEGHQIDLLLTGIKMEPMDGDEMLAIIRKKGSDLPAIVLSAYVTVERIQKFTALGMYDFFKKPFEIEDLLSAVRKALAYAVADGSSPSEFEEAKKYKHHNAKNLLRVNS